MVTTIRDTGALPETPADTVWLLLGVGSGRHAVGRRVAGNPRRDRLATAGHPRRVFDRVGNGHRVLSLGSGTDGPNENHRQKADRLSRAGSLYHCNLACRLGRARMRSSRTTTWSFPPASRVPVGDLVDDELIRFQETPSDRARDH